MMTKKETYVAARARLLEEMPAFDPRYYEAVTFNRGSYLKYPYFILGSRYERYPHKLTFSAQALHDEGGHSLWLDIRGMSAQEFDKYVKAHYAR
jgi:hypothetical protein